MEKNVMVVTPVYCTKENCRTPLLFQSIYWVAQQTYRNLDHIIVDDGSTDSTPELLDRIAQHNLHIEVFHKSNSGSSSAVNYGVSKALSRKDYDYITIHHSDDLLPPESIERRVDSMIENNAKFIYSDMLVFHNQTGITSRMKAQEFPGEQNLFRALMDHYEIPYQTMLWEREFFTERLGGYDGRITSAEDWDIALRSAQELSSIHGKHATIHDITAVYRIHKKRLIYQNLKDGTKWNCYKMILKKHLCGRNYQIALVKHWIRIMRASLPQSIKKPLRDLRNIISKRPLEFIPYTSEFIGSLNSIQYETVVIPSNQWKKAANT